MPLPLAHSLIGATVAAALDKGAEVRWRLLCLGGFLAVCPDFDYFLNWLQIGRGGWHHGFTHSIVFAMFVGAITAFVCRWRSVRGFIICCAATVSHTLLDYVITESRGVALWWPFIDQRYKLRVPSPIDYTVRSASLWEATVDVLRICLLELIIFTPLLLLVILLRRSWQRIGNQ